MQRPKRFKIARRLGPSVFEQTQTERFALSEARKKKAPQKDKRRKNISAYNVSLRDKQRLRLFYGLPERQFKRYVKESSELKTGNAVHNLFMRLESRLDNVVYRIGLAPTHRAARQMVSHGHITVNGKKIRVPSHIVSIGDTVAIRAGSIEKKIFTGEQPEVKHIPVWLKEGDVERTWKVASAPRAEDIPEVFNMQSVVEYYSR